MSAPALIVELERDRAFGVDPSASSIGARSAVGTAEVVQAVS